MTASTSSGTVRLTREGDVVHLQICGSLDLEQTRQMLDRVGQVSREMGRAYLLADLTQLVSIPHDSRRAIGVWSKTHHATAAALYGANFAMRTVTSLLFQAVRLIGNKHFELEFARDEATARRWIDAHRARQSGLPVDA
ncbi:STAS/SEC14 domain-containing protein [Nannocystis sp. RBIL2]|uniref:STAS/SEC14 domain-containing protein n=1 Tax=Nannocystis sp. RBIL2 TaxID=2996788 RepID=UPI002271F759|nr:STAS/SEC14 domain-containing protein [Nannocystis sp. RBIL2]